MTLRRGVATVAIVALALAACDTSTTPITSSSSPINGAPSPMSTPTPSPTPLQTAVASPSAAPSVAPTPSPPAAPSDIARLDGLRTDPAKASRLPLAIMIDDNVAARPQAGFNAASIVYQAPADGGEDRYMLVFQERDSDVVGPVRSGRPYFVRWAAEFRSAFGHYGGDAKTLQQVIPSVDGRLIYNMDALFGAGKAYHRVSDRSAPHNAYTATKLFRSIAVGRGAPPSMSADLASWTFVADRPSAERPQKGSITIPYGRGATGYTYDRTSNTYLRSVAGRAQVDAADRKRVAARNVVVLFMRLTYDPDSEPGHRRPILDQIGTGKAIVFRDGAMIRGTWRKNDEGSLTRFYDAAGKEIALVRGRVFIQVVPTGTKVTTTFH
jgi:hypothetical protein